MIESDRTISSEEWEAQKFRQTTALFQWIISGLTFGPVFNTKLTI